MKITAKTIIDNRITITGNELCAEEGECIIICTVPMKKGYRLVTDEEKKIYHKPSCCQLLVGGRYFKSISDNWTTGNVYVIPEDYEWSGEELFELEHRCENGVVQKAKVNKKQMEVLGFKL